MSDQPTTQGDHDGHHDGHHDGGRDDASPAYRVVLYVRQGCHLCDGARTALAPVLGPDGWVEVDIDAGPESDRLVAAYGDLVPVVTVDGVQQGFWRVDAERVRRALADGPP